MELTNSTGNRRTPVIDHCFGAGKTSLVWKFRKILGEIFKQSPEYLKRFDKNALEKLCAAVYLHIPFRSDMLTLSALKGCKDKTTDELTNVVNNLIYTQIILKLGSSRGDAFSVEQTFDGLMKIISGIRNTGFLFHFDDIGAFELHSSQLGVLFLYQLWKIAEVLRDSGHFFVLTGRSAFLHLIGKQFKNPLNLYFTSIA